MDSRGNSSASALAIKVVSEAGGQALLSAGVPGGDVVIAALLNDLLGVQDEQAAAVGRIDQSVQLLIDEPWKTARGLIREAGLPGSAMKDRRAKLGEAASALRRAISYQPERSFALAYVSLDLAIVLRMLRDLPASALYAEQALAAAAGCLRDAADWTAAERARAQQQSQLPEWRQMLGSAGEYLRAGRQAPPTWQQQSDWRRELRLQFAEVARSVASLGLDLSDRSDLRDLDQRWREAFPWDLADPGEGPRPAFTSARALLQRTLPALPGSPMAARFGSSVPRPSSLLPAELRVPRAADRVA
jgi:hypothetical protein